MKYDAVYVVDERGKRKAVVTGLKESWWSPYVGRRVAKDGHEVFDGNGWQLWTQEYEDEDIVVNLKAVEKNGIVKEIRFYKIQNIGGPHGRPQTRDLSLSAEDIAAFREQLELATVPRGKTMKSRKRIKAEIAAEGLIAGFEALAGAIEKGDREGIAAHLKFSNVYLDPGVSLVAKALERSDFETFAALIAHGAYIERNCVQITKDPGWTIEEIERIVSVGRNGLKIELPISTYKKVIAEKPELSERAVYGQKFERVKACYDAKNFELFEKEILRKDTSVDTSVPVFGKMQFKDLEKREPKWARLIMKVYGYCYRHEQWRFERMRDRLQEGDWTGFEKVVKEYGFEYDKMMADAFGWFNPDPKDVKAKKLLSKVLKRSISRVVDKGRFYGESEWRHLYDAVMDYGTAAEKQLAGKLKQ